MDESRPIPIEERIERILEKVLREIRDTIIRELFREITDILKEMALNMNQLTARVDELTQRVNQLTEQVSRLVGAVGEIRGEVSEWKVVDSMKGVFNRFGLEVYASPWRLFDAYVIGDGFLAIVEICVNCRESDIDQIKRAISVAIDKLGSRPNALAVFSLKKPKSSVIEYGRRMGVIVENSPIRLAKALRELMEKSKKTK